MYCRSCGTEINPKAEICVNCGVKPFSENNFCQECGAPTKEKQEICIQCGSRLKTAKQTSSFTLSSQDLIYPSNPPKSPSTATLLSCLFSGAGQIYLGQVAKGFVIIVGALVLGSISYGTLAVTVNIISMIDAYTIGKKLLLGNPVGQWDWF